MRTWQQGVETQPLARNFEAEPYFLGGWVRGDIMKPVAGGPLELEFN